MGISRQLKLASHAGGVGSEPTTQAEGAQHIKRDDGHSSGAQIAPGVHHRSVLTGCSPMSRMLL